jgi:hypothetical protein
MIDPVQIFADIEQGSPEWHELRRGIPTASMFKVLMVKNEVQKQRGTYLNKLAGERITEQPAVSFVNEYMEKGKEVEPEIRRHYAFVRNCEPVQVAFIRNGKCGASPDALIDDDGMLEIKKAEPHILIPMLEKLREDPAYFPPEHIPQCQGNLMVADRKWIDLIVWAHPKMRPLIVRAERDEHYIGQLRLEVDRFDLELRRLVERLK